MSSYKDTLGALIRDRKARVGIMGMGYVGYPMAYLAASQGFTVTGVDVDPVRVQKINRGESYIQDVSSAEVKPLVEKGRLRGATDYQVAKELDVVMITVPTPLNKTGDPDMSFVVSVLESIKPHLHAGMLIALESTTYPGTTEELFVPAIQEKGFKVGEEVFVGFSPERIDPGNPTYGPKNTPKVVGGVTPACTEIATDFYRQLVDTVVPVSSTTTAEMVKLYENTFRAINIGLVNELAIICDLLKVDVWEILDAASSKPFGFMRFNPGPGLGGHCIPVDPSYLAWKMRTLAYKTRFIELATEVNTGMPIWVVNRAAALLNNERKPVNGAKILILGMSYKNDIDDLRESPALDIFNLLVRRGGIVSYHDPYCPQVRLQHGLERSSVLSPGLLKEQDLVIIVTGHKRMVDYNLVLNHAHLIFDTRNILREIAEKGKAKVVYL